MNLDKNALELKVNEIAADLGGITLGEMLAGGVVSDIYAAELRLADGTAQNIVVKYTKAEISVSKIFSRADIENSFSKAQDTHNLDIQIQEALQLNTPEIIRHFPVERITLMHNFNDKGFQLLQNLILAGNVPDRAYENMGRELARIKDRLSQFGGKFEQVELPETQFDERFYELKTLLYNGRMDMFNQIQEDFLNDHKDHLVWTDGDQKNFAINTEGEVMSFDLGRSIKCDPEFMLPNLLGHLGLFFIAGYIDNGIEHFEQCVKGFSGEINEVRFVNYFTTAVLHRGLAMRWIDPRIAEKIGEDSLKNACMHFGDMVFDKENRITTIANLFATIEAVREAATNGKYKRPEAY